jgi:hypothetical protein
MVMEMEAPASQMIGYLVRLLDPQMMKNLEGA